MWFDPGLWLRISELATEAEILRNWLAVFKHTLGTGPVELKFFLVLLLIRDIDPLFDALQMHELIAACACPN